MTTTTATRQIAKVLTFEARFVPYINWQRVGDDTRELNCDVDIRRDTTGSITITFFWDNR